MQVSFGMDDFSNEMLFEFGSRVARLIGQWELDYSAPENTLSWHRKNFFGNDVMRFTMYFYEDAETQFIFSAKFKQTDDSPDINKYDGTYHYSARETYKYSARGTDLKDVLLCVHAAELKMLLNDYNVLGINNEYKTTYDIETKKREKSPDLESLRKYFSYFKKDDCIESIQYKKIKWPS